MKTAFVSIDATYAHSTITIMADGQPLSNLLLNDIRASSHLITHLSSLLAKRNLSLNDLSFIAINKGPGSFTSLRVSVATVNGIAFGINVPLIGVDGLTALCCQLAMASPVVAPGEQGPLFVALLNAYNNDVYYTMAAQTAMGNDGLPVLAVQESGCKKIEEVLQLLTQCGTRPLVIGGNAVPLHQALIAGVLSAQQVRLMPDATASATTIGRMAYAMFMRHEGVVTKIEPNYLKSQNFAIRHPSLTSNAA
jgi:tRNA threonylcarbamoyl adenosine modification protein YeaZ